MLSCAILAGALFVTADNNSIRVDTIVRIDRTLSGRVEVFQKTGGKPASFFVESLADDKDASPMAVIQEAVAPCADRLAQ